MNKISISNMSTNDFLKPMSVIIKPMIIAKSIAKSHETGTETLSSKLSGSQIRELKRMAVVSGRADRANSRVAILSNQMVWLDSQSHDLMSSAVCGLTPPHKKRLETSIEQKLDCRWRAESLTGCQVRCSRNKIVPFTMLILSKDGQRVLETVTFYEPGLLTEWRHKLSQALVIFDDFKLRYQVVTQSARTSTSVSYLLRCVDSGKQFVGRFWDFSNTDTLERILTEAKLMIAIGDKSVVPSYHELTLDQNKIGLINEFVEGRPFDEWFQDTWCYKLGAKKGGKEVTELMLKVSSCVEILHTLDISHNNITNQTLLVKEKTSGEFTSRNRVSAIQEIPFDLSKELSSIANIPPVTPGKSTFQNSSFLQKLMKAKSFQSADLRFDMQTVNAESGERTDREGTYSFYFEDLSRAEITSKTTLNMFERRKGKNNIRLAKDIYSVGILFVEVLFGAQFDHSHKIALAGLQTWSYSQDPLKIIMEKEPLYNVDPKILETITQMVDSNPEKRPSMSTVVEFLQRSLTDFHDSLQRPFEGPKPRLQSPKNLGFASRLSFDMFENSWVRGSSTKRSKVMPDNLINLLSPMTNKHRQLSYQNRPSIGKKTLEKRNNFSIAVNSLETVKTERGVTEAGTISKEIEDQESEQKILSRQGPRKLSLFARTPKRSEGHPLVTNSGAIPRKPSLSCQDIPQLSASAASTETPGGPLVRLAPSLNNRSISAHAVIWFGREQFKQTNKPKQVQLVDSPRHRNRIPHFQIHLQKNKPYENFSSSK